MARPASEDKSDFKRPGRDLFFLFLGLGTGSAMFKHFSKRNETQLLEDLIVSTKKRFSDDLLTCVIYQDGHDPDAVPPYPLPATSRGRWVRDGQQWLYEYKVPSQRSQLESRISVCKNGSACGRG